MSEITELISVGAKIQTTQILPIFKPTLFIIFITQSMEHVINDMKVNFKWYPESTLESTKYKV